MDSVTTIKGYKDVSAGSETDLKDAVNQQPVAIAIEVRLLTSSPICLLPVICFVNVSLRARGLL
jgi:stage V sporulation protein SpoVS